MVQQCGAHEKLEDSLDSINEKLDIIMDRQLDYSNRITKLETIVTNGLSHNVIEIRSKLEQVCEQYGKRLAVLESFSWFRKSVNKLRDNLFIYLIQVSIVGGVVYALVHFGKEIVQAVLK
jgi:archaellum component FlaC